MAQEAFSFSEVSNSCFWRRTRLQDLMPAFGSSLPHMPKYKPNSPQHRKSQTREELKSRCQRLMSSAFCFRAGGYQVDEPSPSICHLSKPFHTFNPTTDELCEMQFSSLLFLTRHLRRNQSSQFFLKSLAGILLVFA